VQGCAATPNYLLSVLADYGKKEQLRDVELIHIPTVGPATYTEPEYEGISLFAYFDVSHGTAPKLVELTVLCYYLIVL
jgi:hypothetical protein